MNMKCAGLTVILAVSLWTGARAETVVVKFASLAPKGSAWDQSIRETDRQWRKASGGKVRMRIFSGTLGDESDIMRRVRIGQIDAATVTTAALNDIDPAIRAMHIPMAFATEEELDYVWWRLTGRLEKVLLDKGYVVLNWATAGWVYFFTNAPVQRIQDLKEQKLFIWTTGESAIEEKLWKRMGFRPVPLSTVDILPGLQTGMITAFQAPPIIALGNQWFPFAGWLVDLKWAPVMGATVISARTWRRIPPELRDILMTIARKTGDEMIKVIRDLERDAVRAMVKRGLKVVPVPPDALQGWRTQTETIYPAIRGPIIPAEYFDEALRLRDEYRITAAERPDASRR